MNAQTMNRRFIAFAVYNDLDEAPIYRYRIESARRVANRLRNRYGEAWIYGLPGDAFAPECELEFWN